MPTTSQLFGLTPQEHAAAVITALGEGGPNNDVKGPYVVLINRKLSGLYPGGNLAKYSKEPGQFVANDKYTFAQVTSPAFGREIYGPRYDEVYNKLNNPSNLLNVVKTLKGAVEFKGQTIPNKYGDPMLDKLGNFYHNFNPNAYKKALEILSNQKAVNNQVSSTVGSEPRSPGSPLPQTTTTEPYKMAPFDFNSSLAEALASNLTKSVGGQDDYLQAVSLLQKANDTEEESPDIADIYKSQAMSVMNNSSFNPDPGNLIKSVIEVTNRQKTYDETASKIESIINSIKPAQTAQAVNQNLQTGAKPDQGVALAPGRPVTYKGVSITDPNDTGGKGFDFVIAGGRRGEQFMSPFTAEVLKINKDSREFNLEKGATQRAYGNNVELRFRTPKGTTVDTLIAHFDQLNPNLKQGSVIPAGTFLGTQGRTGSTTGPHVSMDFFDPGATTASSKVIEVKNLIRDRIAKGLPIFG